MTISKPENTASKLQNRVYSVSVFAMLSIIAGIYGFIYEIIFYYLNGDMKLVYW